MRRLIFAIAVILGSFAHAAEIVPAGGFPFCSSKDEMQELLRKAKDKSWEPPGDLDCLFLKAGLRMESIREIKGMSSIGQVKEVRVFIPGQNRSISGYVFIMAPR